MACACGPAPKVTRPGGAGPSAPPVSGIVTTNPEITVRSEDKRSAFVVNAKQSNVTVGAAGPTSGGLDDVDGRIEKDGKVLSRFQAPSALIDKDKGTLLLKSAVKVTDLERGLTLKAESVFYDQGKGRIEARGSVTVTSEAMQMGPLPELWASPDLTKIATPGKFK
ncbi:MAG: hypothetical protein JSS66_13545 [Armatimonadetes bacterium]|nr:hypothetical protein [Armatimonadota bacterium]